MCTVDYNRTSKKYKTKKPLFKQQWRENEIIKIYTINPKRERKRKKGNSR